MRKEAGRKALAIAAASLVAWGALPALAQGPSPRPEAELKNILDAFSSSRPGCAIGVEHGNDRVVQAAGSADLEQQTPITADTVFEAGSVSKQFTAAAILLLARDRLLSLEDDVRKYVPELPQYPSPVTIGRLLNHTSGLRDWGSLQELAGWPRGDKVYGMQEALRIMSKQKSLNYEPGTAYSYTNSGYNLLAIIVERVSGKSLQAFSKERLFSPLGMAHTQWRENFRTIVPGRAVAYAKANGSYVQKMPFENIVGNGGLLTTIDDLLRWNDALNEGKVGSDITRQMEEPSTLKNGQRIKYGKGLFVDQYHGQTEVYHEGLTAGYHAWLGRFPARSLSIAILCNSQDIDTSGTAHRIADLYLPSQPSPSSHLTPKEMDRLEGVYVNKRSGMPLNLFQRAGALYLATGVSISQTSNAVPVTKDGEGLLIAGRVMLERVSDGHLRQAIVGDWIELERAGSGASEVRNLPGRYRSAELDANFVISATPQCLVMTVEDRPSQQACLKPAYRDAFIFRNMMVRPVRSPSGDVAAIRLSSDRVWDLRADRAD